MLSCFETTVAVINNALQPHESFALWFEAEQSQFIRFNQGRIRQASHVQQAQIQLQLMWQGRIVTGRLTLQDSLTANAERVYSWIQHQRNHLKTLPSDPHLIVPATVNNSESIDKNQLPPAQEALQDILSHQQKVDLAGLYACGPVYRGFANSAGQRNFVQRNSFNLDCSLHANNQAVKLNHTGSQWNSPAIQNQLQQSKQQLQQLQQLQCPCKCIQPGTYRAYLAPAAVGEILFTLACWGAFSLQAYRSKSSVLQSMQPGQACFHKNITLQENTAQGFGPCFQQQGFIRPDYVNLIQQGSLQNHLASPRCAQQYNAICNGANDSEMPESLDMSPGQLEEQDILKQLDTGLYIGNLWYINPSDLPQGRLTGMTRFFTCWVQNGQLQGPVEPMRFDDTAYNLFGQYVEQLTRQRQLFLDPSTYDQRNTNSMRLPGMLLSQLRLTL